MSDASWPKVAIVDYGMGNLFSVKHACEHVGLKASITASNLEILAADAVILPGVGAFGDAMKMLTRLDLERALLDFAASGKQLVGICLGMQLLMTESHEFGQHRGLGIIEGEVVRLEESVDGVRRLKVPQVGWNRIYTVRQSVPPYEDRTDSSPWQGTLLEGLPDGEFMYFVHSFYPRTIDPTVVLSATRYGQIEFRSSLRLGNVFACQFHPERSGPQGLHIYRNLARSITRSRLEALNA
ncbi:MAG: imidazole glycerol phosphate synthase subunit HisH [Candidatus Methylomirabilales bacterium]